MDWNMILDFIIEYWRELLSGLAIIITVFLNIFRKRLAWNGVDEIKEDVLVLLPSFINKVEEDGNGQRKKEAVLRLVELFVKKKFKVDLPETLKVFFSESIESILSTPQKKKGN